MTMTIDDIKGMNLQVGDKIEIKIIDKTEKIGYYGGFYDYPSQMLISLIKTKEGHFEDSRPHYIGAITEINKLTYEKK
jgi:hypothetical protein